MFKILKTIFGKSKPPAWAITDENAPKHKIVMSFNNQTGRYVWTLKELKIASFPSHISKWKDYSPVPGCQHVPDYDKACRWAKHYELPMPEKAPW